MLTGAGLVVLTGTHDLWVWLAGTLLCRELALSGVRLVAQQQGISIHVQALGKWKTLFLDVAIVCLMVNRPLFGWPFSEVGMVCIWVALFLSLYSAWTYVAEFWQKIKID
jgi:CDP-diacylglycerol--glycerol-3-phosphate 3-phosphatidyltransferase